MLRRLGRFGLQWIVRVDLHRKRPRDRYVVVIGLLGDTRTQFLAQCSRPILPRGLLEQLSLGGELAAAGCSTRVDDSGCDEVEALDLAFAQPTGSAELIGAMAWLGQPGALNFGQALAMCSILMLVCAVSFLAIERFRVGDEGEFI